MGMHARRARCKIAFPATPTNAKGFLFRKNWLPLPLKKYFMNSSKSAFETAYLYNFWIFG